MDATPLPAATLDAIALEARHCARNYAPLPIVLARGDGVHLVDVEGRRYLDFMSAYSAASFGHGHPRLVAALTEQAGRLALTSRAFHSDRLGPFAERLCALTGMERMVPMNTGAEAVETAIKAARKWAYTVKGVPRDRARIVVCRDNFAGRTTTLVGFSSEPQYRDGFGPFAPGFDEVPFGDLDALDAALGPDTAALLVEPIQGEAGIRVAPRGWLAGAARLCRDRNVLLIVDEVQTGLGRTGRLLACDHEGVTPDGLVLGKALGGGLLPVSAFLARRDVMDVFGPGDHGSTFGGSPLGAAVGLAALDLLVELDLPARAARAGERALARLRAIRHPALRDVRGAGLLIGLELDPAIVDAREFCLSLARRGVLTKDTHGTVVRIAPPLVIDDADLDHGLAAVESAFAELPDSSIPSTSS